MVNCVPMRSRTLRNAGTKNLSSRPGEGRLSRVTIGSTLSSPITNHGAFMCLSYQARMRFSRSSRCFSSWKPCGSRGYTTSSASTP